MQVFVPFDNNYQIACCLDRRRLWKQVLESTQILKTIHGLSNAWKNHPIIKMYEPYVGWLSNYSSCLESFWRGDLGNAKIYSDINLEMSPMFFTQAFLDNNKRRLYTKDPMHYIQFQNLGTSDVNMYWSWEIHDWLYYRNGKRL